MARHFQAFGMSLVYGGLQSRLIDEHIPLERSAALAGPEVDKGLRLRGSAQLMHSGEDTALTLQVGRSHVHFRSKDLALIDIAFQVEVGIGLNASGCTYRRCTAGQV